MTEAKSAGGDKAQERPIFTPRTTVDLALRWPALYQGAVFGFHMRIQLVEDAERVHTEFIMLPDAEQTADRRHMMDARLLALLAVAPPDGFPDFPEANSSNDLETIIYDYFYEGAKKAGPERLEGMRFICRGTMSAYWKAISPADFL